MAHQSMAEEKISICINCIHHLVDTGWKPEYSCAKDFSINPVTGNRIYCKCSDKNSDGKCTDYEPFPPDKCTDFEPIAVKIICGLSVLAVIMVILGWVLIK